MRACVTSTPLKMIQKFLHSWGWQCCTGVTHVLPELQGNTWHCECPLLHILHDQIGSASTKAEECGWQAELQELYDLHTKPCAILEMHIIFESALHNLCCKMHSDVGQKWYSVKGDKEFVAGEDLGLDELSEGLGVRTWS